MASCVHLKTKTKLHSITEREDMKICMQLLILTRDEYDDKLQTTSRKPFTLPIVPYYGM